MAPEYWVVIPGAGAGSRFGGELPKQYLSVAGRAVLAWTLSRFLDCDWVNGIVVPLAHEDSQFSLLQESRDPRISSCKGGETRAASVMTGLRSVESRCADPSQTRVLIHDAARPCVSVDALQRLRDTAGGEDGGLLALPVSDTLKRGQQQCVIETVPRDGLWRAQTPQMFPLRRIIQALECAAADGVETTDDAQAMERIGARPVLVAGEESNIKLTWPGDLSWLEQVLAQEARP